MHSLWIIKASRRDILWVIQIEFLFGFENCSLLTFEYWCAWSSGNSQQGSSHMAHGGQLASERTSDFSILPPAKCLAALDPLPGISRHASHPSAQHQPARSSLHPLILCDALSCHTYKKDSRYNRKRKPKPPFIFPPSFPFFPSVIH